MGSKLILYIAMSLDGYIAARDGSIGFLDDTSTSLPDLGYETFYSSIGSIIMGGKTYRQVKNELSPGKWIYEGMPCYAYSHERNSNDSNVKFTQLAPAQLLCEIRKNHTGNIWLMGGGEVIHGFMRENLIDEYYIYVMPTLLGDGIPLFIKDFPKIDLTLTRATGIGQITELVYCKKTP